MSFFSENSSKVYKYYSLYDTIMGRNNDIKVMLILLVIVTLGIGYLLAQEGYIVSEEVIMEKNSKEIQSTPMYVEVYGGQEVTKSNKVIISDKFVGEFNADGQVVVLDSSGSAFIVHDGVVLASNEIIIDARNEGLSVMRINEPSKSVSSN